jgi:hypothetical protein
MGIAFVYAAYLAVSIGLTVIVASALSRSGRVYLAEAFGGDDGMAIAVNRMLVVGFCLLSLGYAALTLRTSADIHGPGQAISVLSVKVGEELLVLGALHLVNMMFFTRLRRRQEAGGRPGAPAAGRRASGWPRGTVSGRPATVDRPDTATVTGRPSGTDWPPAAAVSVRAGATDRPEAATDRPEAATDRPEAVTITGQVGATPSRQAGAADMGWPVAGGLSTAGPGRPAAAWPAPPAAREALH